MAAASSTVLALLLLALPAWAGEAIALPACDGAFEYAALPLTLHAEDLPEPALLLVEEIGWELQTRADSAEFAELAAGPPRLALALLRIEPKGTLQIRARGEIQDAQLRLRRVCEPEPALLGLPDCAGPSGAACRALALQQQAAEASREGASEQALQRYQETADAWVEYGDLLRAAAARFGVAQRLATLARFNEALAALPKFNDADRPRAAAYYSARAEGDRCLWLRRRGDTEQGLECIRAMPARYAALGESSEQANAWLNLAVMQIEQGEGIQARASLAEAKRSAALTDLVSGRIGVLQARVDYEEGRVPEALRAAEQALALLETTPDWTWQVHAMLRLASLQLDLGAIAEARHWVQRALAVLQGKHSPRVLAKLRLLQARIESVGDEPASAVLAALAARAAFAADRDPAYGLQAGLLLHRLQPEAISMALLREEANALQPLARAQLARALTLAEAADRLRAGDDAGARSALESAQGSLYLDEREQALALSVHLDLRTGHYASALQQIESAVDELLLLVQRAGSAGLRHLLARRLGGLRQLWVDTYTQLPASARPAPDAVWRVLLTTHAPRQLRGLPTSDRSSALQRRALMRAHLGEEADSIASAAERELLRQLLAPRDHADVSAPPELADWQAQLPADTRLLAWGVGRRSALLLQVGTHTADVQFLGTASALVDSLHRLDRAIRSADTPLATLEAQARTLSSALLPTQPRGAVRRIFSLMDPALPHPPLGLLTWPGDSEPLLKQTVLSRVDDAPQEAVGLPTAEDAHVLYASGDNTADRPRLRNAALESRLLGQTWPQLRVHPTAFTRPAQLQSALAESNSWVHVAAHGETRRGLQGYAGLWMDAGPDQAKARFLSWLELAGYPVHSPLVVLNACALADAGDAQVGGSASFAAAISAAGADHVIAGQWAVSDGAAALWVQALYAGLAEHGDPARALQGAQQRLQASRAYRHPFYWAGLVHLQR